MAYSDSVHYQLFFHIIYQKNSKITLACISDEKRNADKMSLRSLKDIHTSAKISAFKTLQPGTNYTRKPPVSFFAAPFASQNKIAHQVQFWNNNVRSIM